MTARPLVILAELLDGAILAALRRRFGLPEYSTSNQVEDVDFAEWRRLMEQPPGADHEDGLTAIRVGSGVAV